MFCVIGGADLSVFFGSRDISSLYLDDKFKEKIQKNNNVNKRIADYYWQMKNEFKDDRFIKKSYDVQNCNKFWTVDLYRLQHVKDFKKTYLCKDKFCANCKKVKQAYRLKKYLPLLAKNDKDMYFVTFTVPNCRGSDLSAVLKNLNTSFHKLIRYVSCSHALKICNFGKFGYLGAIKSLEITVNRTRKNKYHPHLHCAICFKNFKQSKPYIINRYSKDWSGKKDYFRKFTNEEVILQKLWFLIYNGVDLKGLDSVNSYVNEFGKLTLNRGYSVTIDKFKPGQYREIFKYMIKDKVIDKVNVDGSVIQDYVSYIEFKDLYFGTKNVRQLEGFGIFRNVKDEKSLVDKQQVENIYNEFICYLKKKEAPVEIEQESKQSLFDDYIYISKKVIFKYLKSVMLENEFKDVNVDCVDNHISNKYYIAISAFIKQLFNLKE